MESEKRKREDEDDPTETVTVTEKKRSTKAEQGEKTVSEEEEVEEFFAILKRIHAAVKYFKKADGSGRKLMATKTWEPSFEVEDFFEGDNGGRDDRGIDDGFARQEEAAEAAEGGSAGLDLNSEPDKLI